MNRFLWVYSEANTKSVTLLCEALNISKHFSEVLVRRNITNFEEARQFFCPSFTQLHSPLLLKDIEKAICRLEAALHQNEKILIYGDYDVDGTSSVSLLYLFLHEYLHYPKSKIDIYIPDRARDGYGVHENGVRYILQSGASLVITVDCGITSVREMAILKSHQIDCIICDHHLPSETLPDVQAILNPKQKDCPYPFKELSACGVVFKWICAFAKKKNIAEEKLWCLLDLVALSTAADIVPLTGENRNLVSLGIDVLKKRERLALACLADATQLKEFNVEELVFRIAPRINAAGRIEHAKRSVDLLISQDIKEIQHIIRSLNEMNTDRRSLQDAVFEEAKEQYMAHQAKLPFVIIVFGENWFKGVLGIVASKLTELFSKPAIVLTKDNDYWVGSGRSVEGVDLYHLLSACQKYIYQFGGHVAAAGMKITAYHLESFIFHMQQSFLQHYDKQVLEARLHIDGKITLDTINDKFLSFLERMKPFGPANHNPLWLIQNIQLQEPAQVIKEKHLRLIWQQGNTTKFSSILFHHAKHYMPHLHVGETYHVLLKLKKEIWNNQERVSAVVEDIAEMD